MNYRIGMLLGVLWLCAGCVRVIEIASLPDRIEHDAGSDELRPRIPIAPTVHLTSCMEDGWIVTYHYVDYIHRRCTLLPRDPKLQSERRRVVMPRIQQSHWKSERLAVSYEERLRERRAARVRSGGQGAAL